MMQTWINVEQQLGENVPNSQSTEILEEIFTNKRTVSNTELCRAFIYSTVSVLEDLALINCVLPVRLLTCRRTCNFTHMSYSSRSVGMFRVLLLTWLKAGRIRALAFHNLPKGCYESALVRIRKNAQFERSAVVCAEKPQHKSEVLRNPLRVLWTFLTWFIPQKNEGTCDLQSWVSFGFSWILHFTCKPSMRLLVSRNRVHT